MCTAVSDWGDDLKARTNERVRRVSRSRSLAQTRNETVDYYADALARTDRLLEQMDAVDPPALASRNGDVLQEDFRRAILILREGLVVARRKSRRLPSSPQEFFAAHRRIGLATRNASNRVERFLDHLEDSYDIPEINRAEAELPECKPRRARPKRS